MTKPYIGAYSRRFSNFTASNKETTSPDPGNGSNYNLSVTSGEPEMGEAGFIQLAASSPFATQQAAQPTVATRGGYAAGTSFRAVAKANPCYRFVQWQTNIDGVGNTTQNPIEFKLTKNTWLVARFEVAQGAANNTSRTANVSWDGQMGRVNGNGLVLSEDSRAGSGVLTATAGSTVSLTASPLDGFHFVKWHGAPVDGKTSKTVSFQMNNNYAIRAEFAADGNGSGNSGGTGVSGTIGNNDDVAEVVVTDTVISKQSTADRAIAFAKKWWWAIAIGLYVILKDRKGGSK